MLKKLLSGFIVVLSVAGCFACANKDAPKKETTNSQNLQFFNTTLKLSQDQVLSKIKAENLKKNNGYLDSDEIVTIITLSNNSLIKTYNEEYSYRVKSVADYAVSKAGIEQAEQLKSQQAALIKKLENDGIKFEVESSYTTVMNAIAVKTTYGDFKKISNLSYVNKAIISDTYNLPKSAGHQSGSAIENLVNVYDTGIFDSSSVDFTGYKTVVAVLDSGFDCSHSVFANQPTQVLFTTDTIKDVLALTRAYEYTPGLKYSDVYESAKIPFKYDYADKDSDVSPYDSEHGTHVAGIIGGKDDVITGVAVNTQLALMKVFPDLNAGAKTEDILLALEDAVLLGVDCINMSLGSSCGFSRAEDSLDVNRVYDLINESGINLITAASNSYSSSFGGAQGDTNFVTNPDSGTVGSPSTYAAALSVASISGVKSKYMVANGSDIMYFTESNAMNGKPNDFFKELGVTPGNPQTFEYVTVPGSGLKVNFIGLDLEGKIALIRRGNNTFEEKAANAKAAGAIGCIIYNNVDGDISMSMGKSDHIPTISISKNNGTILALKDHGTLVVDLKNQAGPFMSDFSSWGPSPNLELKPEITAHGGNIKSSIPGGGYDELSGTSMASPNLCGIMVLIRQYLKEKFPTKTAVELKILANELIMSTATIIQNEDGNPYSPRKQGAGLASLFNSVNTKAYITIDGKDRTKLDLLDDPKRTGEYTMEFNVVNFSDESLTYNMSVVGMTETVSTYDELHVAERGQVLEGSKTYQVIEGGKLAGNQLTVEPNATAKVVVKYKLTDSEKDLIESLFPYGMYVEGFVKLEPTDEEEIKLNVPFLAFYGDWSEAPLFDKTFYDVEAEAHDASIDEEDKLKADYFATTPYGSYYYNYMIPLGQYLYDIDESIYDPIPASKDKIALSNVLGCIDGFSAIYAGLLRNAKTMTYTITDKITGEQIFTTIDENATKSFYNGGPFPYFNYLKLKSSELGLVNNRQYEFKMTGLLDFKNDGLTTNKNNTFSFDFCLDNEAPVLKSVSYEKEYDKTAKKDRYYMDLVIYDNQYVQSISPILFTTDKKYTQLTDTPIPVYSEKGKDATCRIEITDYLDDLYTGKIITSALGLSIDDYALNSNIYLCQLPGTKGDFKFTEDGTKDGETLSILTVEEGEAVDLTKYLATSDLRDDFDSSYLKFLSWSSSNEDVATVQEGTIVGLKPGKTTVIVQEQMDGKKAALIVNVKAKEETKAVRRSKVSVEEESIESLRFDYFDTVFAFDRGPTYSKIGETGERMYVNSLNGAANFYPGEQIKLHFDLEPWYVADKYELTYNSTNPTVASVDENGLVTGLKKGTTTITLTVKGSNIMAKLKVVINSEFIIENRTLVGYKGLGGKVVIPDDEGILYVSPYAFCLYTTDQTIEVNDDDYDANKIPGKNTTLTEVVIPEGVEEVQKYAFFNCTNLKKVTLPQSCKVIREYAFCKDANLETINTENVTVIGAVAFKDCVKLQNLNLDKIYAIGSYAFDGCTSLTAVNLSTLRNSGNTIFRNCTNLVDVTINENTKLGEAMFVNTGIKEITIYEKIKIPAFCFANCLSLEKVTLANSLVSIETGAFSGNTAMTEFVIEGTIEEIEAQAFYNCTALTEFTLPNNEVVIKEYAFKDCTNLTTLKFQEKSNVTDLFGSIFEGSGLSTFVVDSKNTVLSVDENSKNLLLSADQTKIILAAPGFDYTIFMIPSNIKVIGASSFASTNISILNFPTSIDTMIIENHAFFACMDLISIYFPETSGLVIGDYAFAACEKLGDIQNIQYVKEVNQYAFSKTNVQSITTADNSVYAEGAFFDSKLEKVTLGADSSYGLGAFQNCVNLTTVKMNGNVVIGDACFANDVRLQNVDFEKITGKLGDEAFYMCRLVREANLTNVTEVGAYAFADCGGLLSVTFGNVKSIGEGAFSKNDEKGKAPIFSSIELPETLETIGKAAFLGCSRLKTITIPSKVTVIDDYTFANCTSLTEVKLPEGLKTIGVYAFTSAAVLATINLENVEYIGEYAFYGAASLKTADLKNVVSIGDAGFAATALSGNIVANKLESLGIYVFKTNKITSFTAQNLKVIGEGAFDGCIYLKEFAFSKQLQNIDYVVFNDCKRLAKFGFFDGDTVVYDGKINDYALLDNGVLYTYLPNGHLQLTSIPASLNVEEFVVLDKTQRIDDFAGNKNPYIEKIVFPDSLKLIGQLAFYGYKRLDVVEFKSQTAPILENSYNQDAKLEPGDPGYELLHNVFDMFGMELCYLNFVDLVGKFKPLDMILPKNDDLVGYDSIVFEALFGKVEDAKRSDYLAREAAFVKFVDLMEDLNKIDVITLANKELVYDAVTALFAIKQDPTAFGYTTDEWNKLKTKALDSKEQMQKMLLTTASKETRALQADLETLTTTFTIDKLDLLKSIQKRIQAISLDERTLLDLTNYNALVESYNAYVATVESDATVISQSVSSTVVNMTIVVTALSLAAFIILKKVHR